VRACPELAEGNLIETIPNDSSNRTTNHTRSRNSIITPKTQKPPPTIRSEGANLSHFGYNLRITPTQPPVKQIPQPSIPTKAGIAQSYMRKREWVVMANPRFVDHSMMGGTKTATLRSLLTELRVLLECTLSNLQSRTSCRFPYPAFLTGTGCNG
jgi:hypothetical protein